MSRRKKYVLLAIILVVLGLGYLCYFGLPLYSERSSIYPGKPDVELSARISKLMVELRKQYPDPTLRAKVARIPKEWSQTVKRPGIAIAPLGLGALPYLEEMTRSKDQQVRKIAYEMLLGINAFGKSSDQGIYMTPEEHEKDRQLKLKYVCPIWERALYDPMPRVRELAIKQIGLDLGTKGIPILRRMLRDPDEGVRITATRALSRTYNRPYLVPIVRLLEAQHAGVE